MDALVAQEVDGRWEVVVVLDGIEDASEAVVESYEQSLPLRTVRFTENRGRPAALNAGFAVARGGVLIRCDDDLRPRADFVQAHVNCHTADDLAVIGLYRNRYGPTPYARAWGETANLRDNALAYRSPPERRWLHWAGNCSVRRSLWENVGPYDEAFREYGWEDIEWGYRAWMAGASFVIDPALETDHLAAADSTSARAGRAFLSKRAQVRFEAKHPTAPLAGPAPGASLKARVWGGLVAAGARGPASEVYSRRGHMVDKLGTVLPSQVLHRVISWTIESAGVAGYADGHRHRPASES